MPSPRSGASCFGATQSPIPERKPGHRAERLLPPSVRVKFCRAGACRFSRADIPPRRRRIVIAIYRALLSAGFWRTTFITNLIRRTRRRSCVPPSIVVGKHDFTSFAASDPDRSAAMKEARKKTNVSVLESSNIPHHSFFAMARTEDGNWIYTVAETASTPHGVEIWWETFLLVGKGALKLTMCRRSWKPHRSAAGPTAAARGLYLVSVEY